MKNVMSLLFLSFVVSQALAMPISQPIHFNNMQEWELTAPLPNNIIIAPREKKFSIVIHINRHLKSSRNLVSDTIEFICGNNSIFYRAGATGTCEWPMSANASYGITSTDFHNGSEGSILFVE